MLPWSGGDVAQTGFVLEELFDLEAVAGLGDLVTAPGDGLLALEGDEEAIEVVVDADRRVLRRTDLRLDDAAIADLQHAEGLVDEEGFPTEVEYRARSM